MSKRECRSVFALYLFTFTLNLGEHCPVLASDEAGAYKLLLLKQSFCSALPLPLRLFIVKALLAIFTH